MASRLRRWLRPWWRRLPRRMRRGRVLAVKWGVNPNSSSLGADVTFLLVGMVAVALLTPLVSIVLRARRRPVAALQQGEADSRPEVPA